LSAPPASTTANSARLTPTGALPASAQPSQVPHATNLNFLCQKQLNLLMPPDLNLPFVATFHSSKV